MAINPVLMSMARGQFEKSAVVPPGGGDPSMGAAPPVDPSMGGAPPMDPAAMGGAAPAAPAPPVDPATAMAAMGGAPTPMPAAPAAAPAGPAGGQKLKPEQMMQMIDMRLYNMQQQLTSIMNAMGVQVAPESLVLPPGTTGAPPAEAALPGGPMAPPPPADAGAGAMPPGGMPPDAAAAAPEMAKGADWRAGQILSLHKRAEAIRVLRRSLETDAG